MDPPVLPNAAAAANLHAAWPAWPEPEAVVDQIEVQQVQALADELVQQAMLQLPNANQVSESVSSDALDFYRAQGRPIRLEFPLVQNHQEIIPLMNAAMDRESDYPIFQIANTLKLHQGHGPMPSAQMLLQEILLSTRANQHTMYIERPLNLGIAQFPPLILSLEQSGKQPIVPPRYDSDEDLSWIAQNDWEASTSSNPIMPRRLVRMWDDQDQPKLSEPRQIQPLQDHVDFDLPVHENNQTKIPKVLQNQPLQDHVGFDFPIPKNNLPSEVANDVDETILKLPSETELSASDLVITDKETFTFGIQGALLQDDTCAELIQPEPIQIIPPAAPRKRQIRKRPTPIVDDEVQRNTRRHQLLGFQHMELDQRSMPRKLSKEDTVMLEAHLSTALVQATTDGQAIPVEVMQGIAINFCDVPPEEVTEEKLLSVVPNDD